MAKRRRASWYRVSIRNPESGVKISVTGKTKKQTTARAKRFVKRYLKNVEMGFVDATGFHPIRGSKDYNAGRPGEGKSRAAGKSRAKRYTKKAKRGRQAVS